MTLGDAPAWPTETFIDRFSTLTIKFFELSLFRAPSCSSCVESPRVHTQRVQLIDCCRCCCRSKRNIGASDATKEPEKSPTINWLSNDDLDPSQQHIRPSVITVVQWSIHTYSWRRSTVVERWSLTGELSLSCARLLAGRMITLWVRRPLSVSQHGQLSHPSLRGW